MDFSNTFSVTVDIVPQVIEPNLDNVRTTNDFSYHECFLGFGNSLIILMSFSVFILLPIVEIVIGIIFLNDCSMNNFLPIYLIVAGLISSINLTFAILGWIFILPSIEDFKLKTIQSLFINARIICQILFSLAILVLVFGLAWLITGSIWIFRAQSIVQYTNRIGSPETYCNRIVYLGGLSSIIIKYIFIWIIICQLNCYLYFDTQKLLSKYRRNKELI